MRGVNKVFLLGTLGDEPALRTTKSGVPYAFLTLQTFEEQDLRDPGASPVQWHKALLWNALASGARLLHKGMLVYLEGKIRTVSYTDAGGIRRHSTQVEADVLKIMDDNKAAAAFEEAVSAYNPRARADKGLERGNSEGLAANLRGTYVKGDPFSSQG